MIRSANRVDEKRDYGLHLGKAASEEETTLTVKENVLMTPSEFQDQPSLSRSHRRLEGSVLRILDVLSGAPRSFETRSTSYVPWKLMAALALIGMIVFRAKKLFVHFKDGNFSLKTAEPVSSRLLSRLGLPRLPDASAAAGRP